MDGLALVIEQASEMSTDIPAGPAPSLAAERMRRYRKRRREARQRQADGMHYVQVALHATEVDVLVQMRFLKEEERDDPERLQAAVMGLMYWVLKDPAMVPGY